MGRAIRIALIIYLVILLLVAALVGWVQMNDEVAAGSLARRAEPRVLWGGGESDVTLTYTPPAGLVCPPARRATNVLLLIDKSESMVIDDAFDSALAAAEAFIDATDLSVARAGVIFFDHVPQLTAPPTQDAAQLRASLAGFVPESTTDLAAALILAEQVLADLPGQVAELPAQVVLLTDGQPDETTSAMDAGRTLKNSGVRLITVGVGQSDSTFLRDLASSPADHFEVADASQLPALYAELAEQMRTAVAFDITFVEPVNPDLTVRPESLNPAGALTNNSITWSVPSATAEGASFSYRADAGGLGLRTINAEAATMNYTDCIAGPISTTLSAGPRLLVLPPAWLALVLALLPFLALFLMAFFRRPKPQPAAPLAPPPSPAKPPEPADLFPAWMTRLDETRVLRDEAAETIADSLTPTLIIGVGPVGRVVLPQVAQALQARYGQSLPPSVRLLQVDVQLQGSSAPPLTRPDYLTPDQWVLLEPNLDEVRRNLDRDGERFGHLAWYRAAAPNYDRARGRMALFYDLMNGAGASRIWRALSAAVVGLDKPSLRLVGSTFDDVASGMLVDLARLVQIHSRSDVDAQLWLSLPVGENWSTRLNNPRQKVSTQDQVSRTLATLRELERFQRNAATSFHFVAADHVQAELHSETHMAVVQSLFLFEPPAGSDNVTDHLTTLTDALLAALHTQTQQAIAAQLAQSGAPVTTLTNTEGKGMVCGLGAYAVRLPLEDLAEALNWRLLFELLYDSSVGLMPVVRLTEDGSYEPVNPHDQESREQTVALRESAQEFAAKFGRFGSTPAYRTHLARRVADMLNGEDGSAADTPAFHRSGGLLRAQTWLQFARAEMVRKGHIDAASAVTSLDDRLTEWQRFLLDELRPAIDGRLADAQNELTELSRQTARQWILPAGGDWKAYRTSVRTWTTGHPTSNIAGEPIANAAARFGWYVAYNETARTWKMELLAPPGNFVWNQESSDPSPHRLPNEPQQFAGRLRDLVRPAVTGALQVGPEWVLDEAALLAEDANAWLARAAPRLAYDITQAADYLGRGVSEKVIFVAPRSQQARAISDKLAKGSSRLPVELVETEDVTAATLLRVRDRLPLYTLNHYGQEAWQRQPVLPTLYVWPGEQAAAELELGEDRLSAIFVGWLERDPELLDRFARAYLLGLYENEDEHAYLPGLGEWPAATLGDALDGLMGSNSALRPAPLNGRQRERRQAFDDLDEALEARRQEVWQSTGRASFLRAANAPGGLLDRLRRSKEQRERDLALYLQVRSDQL